MKTRTGSFKEFVNKLQQIRKEPLSKEKVDKINSILEEENKSEDSKDSFEDEKRRIARPGNSYHDGVEFQ